MGEVPGAASRSMPGQSAVGEPSGQSGWGNDARTAPTSPRRLRIGQVDLLARRVGLAEDDAVAFAMHAEGLAVDLAGQIEGLLGHAVPGQFQGVGRHALL